MSYFQNIDDKEHVIEDFNKSIDGYQEYLERVGASITGLIASNHNNLKVSYHIFRGIAYLNIDYPKTSKVPIDEWWTSQHLNRYNWQFSGIRIEKKIVRLNFTLQRNFKEEIQMASLMAGSTLLALTRNDKRRSKKK